MSSVDIGFKNPAGSGSSNNMYTIVDGSETQFTPEQVRDCLSGGGVPVSGSIVQTQIGTMDANFVTESNVLQAIGLSVNITPTSASNRILISSCFNWTISNPNDVANADRTMEIQILRDSSQPYLIRYAEGVQFPIFNETEGQAIGISTPMATEIAGTTSSVNYSINIRSIVDLVSSAVFSSSANNGNALIVAQEIVV